MRLFRSFALFLIAPFTLGAPAECQVSGKPAAEQVASVEVKPGDSVRVYAGARRFDARFLGWSGDTLRVGLFRRDAFLPLKDVDVLMVRTRRPAFAMVSGAIGGGLGGLLARSVWGSFKVFEDDVPSRKTAFARGMIFGGTLSLIRDYANPRFRSRYARSRAGGS